jgi:PPK2 family polyphosphate:nucleotide phosphotransferase
MSGLRAIEHLRVKPGGKASLAGIDPDFCGDLAKEDAEGQLAEDLEALAHLQQLLYAEDRRALLVVLQGIDTAGKDGVIRKVMTGFNPQGCVVTPFKKPAGVELEHDYLWRVHKVCPRRGEIGVFNRSHYEDVLVARVHRLAHGQRLERRYETINGFERMLSDEGTHVVKFFLWISRDEQRKRLEERLRDPEKNWKFSEADLKERERWDEYMEAFELALARCSTEHAPWWIVPANRKWFRNWMVARVLRHTLEGFNMTWPDARIDFSKVRVT